MKKRFIRAKDFLNQNNQEEKTLQLKALKTLKNSIFHVTHKTEIKVYSEDNKN